MSGRIGPVRTTLRFEAIWSITIAQSRSKSPIVRKLLKLLLPQTRELYQPSFARTRGYVASVASSCFEEVDPEDNWPDW
jgi:hypothetical protein